MRSRRARGLLLWLSPLLVLVVVYVAVYTTYRLPAGQGLRPEQASALLKHFRHALQGREAKADSLPTTRLGRPLWVTVYVRGEPAFRLRSQAANLALAAREVAAAMRKDSALAALTPTDRRAARIKLDVLSARGPIFSKVPLAFAKSVVPGLDGVGLQADERAAYLLPDDLFRRQMLAGHQPFFFMHEFKTGLDLRRVVNSLADELRLSTEAWRKARRSFFRFRTVSFVDPPAGEGAALPVLRSRVPVTTIDRATVRQAVIRAADYVLRQIQDDGKFHYQYYPLEDRHSPPGAYSLPRHAGTTWFLSLAYRTLGKHRYLEGAKRAIRYLGQHAVPKACRTTPYACVGQDHYADLGSSALAVVAIAEYQAATKDRSFEQLARRLGRFILWMQKDNGDFCHAYTPKNKRKRCAQRLLYYTGESALALAKLYHMTGDQRFSKALDRALDFLTGEKYDFFLGQFFYSEDHWTCIAAQAVPKELRRERYAKFCYGFAALNRRAQVGPDEGLMRDLVGAFSVTPFFMPHNTPAGSRTEANVATYLLSVARNEPQPEILDTVLRSVRYLVDQQLRPESLYLQPNPSAAVGGMMQTPLRGAIRIDYVQHAAAAMVRALPLIPEVAWRPTE